MSVINQVLNDLEKRGASSPPGGAAIRVVPVRRNWRLLWLIGLLVIMGLLLAGLWNTAPSPSAPPQPLRLTMAVAAAPATDTVEPSADTVVKAEPEKIQTPTVNTAPAMRLSYQLNPLPPLAMQSPPPPVTQKVIIGAEKSPPIIDELPRATKKTADVEHKGVEKQIKQFTPQQNAENEFRRATGLVQKGRSDEALEIYGAVLKLDATHDAARQAMVWLLLESKRNEDAERVLQDGLKINPHNREFATLLARLQVERNDLPLALQTLQISLPYAEQQAEYHAFIAAVYQRMNHHKETITHYQIAVQQAPSAGAWLMGLGISLQALQRNAEARTAFKRAIETQTLSAELQAFVEQRLKEL